MFSDADFGTRFLKTSIPLLAILLLVAAGLNYEWARLTLERQARESLDQDWSAMKGYLRIEI